jgi:hypothetical protein
MNMRELNVSRITAIWLLLVAATLLAWKLGHESREINPKFAGGMIIVVAFIKVRFVIFDFMEIRHAPSWMRLVADAWIVLMAAALLFLLVMAPPPLNT